MAIELWPAILASVHTSQPLSPRRVKTVWRSPYSTKGRTPETFNVLACCFLRESKVQCVRSWWEHPIPSALLDSSLLRECRLEFIARLRKNF
jgi:hypothetical protein